MLSSCISKILEAKEVAKDVAKEKKEQEKKRRTEKSLKIERLLKRKRQSYVRSLRMTLRSLVD
jgi:hypothetical protein